MDRLRLGLLVVLASLGAALLAVEHDLPQRNPVDLYLSADQLAGYRSFREEFDEQPLLLGRIRSSSPSHELLESGLDRIETIAQTAGVELVSGRSLGERFGVEPDPDALLALRRPGQEAFLAVLPSTLQAQEFIEALEDLPADEPALEVDLAGVPFTNYKLDQYSAAIGSRLFPLIFAVGFILVLLITRQLGAAVLIYVPSLLATATSLWTIDLAYGSMDMVTAIVPLLTFVLSLSLALHLHYGAVAAGSWIAGLRHKARPVALMILTTSVGFGALAASEIESIRRFGVLCAILVIATSLVTMVWSMLAAPLALSRRPAPRHPAPRHPAPRHPDLGTPAAGRIIPRWALWHPRPWWIATTSAFLLIAGVYAIKTMPLETDALHYFPPSSGIAERVLALQNEVIGTPVFEILASPPASLSRADALETASRLEAIIGATIPGEIRIISQAALIGETRRRAMGVASLPDSPLATAALWSMVPPILRQAYDSPDTHRITVFAHNRTARQQRSELEDLTRVLTATAPGWRFRFDGIYHRLLLSQSALISLLATSLSISLAIIAGIFWLTTRSLRLLGVFLVTNLVPILGAFAVAGLLGYSLNIATVMVASVALGLIVDSTLHMVHSLPDLSISRHSTTLAREKLPAYFQGTLQPVVMSGAVLVPCFLLFGTFEFVPIREFGVTLGVTLALAVAFNVYALPVLAGCRFDGRWDPCDSGEAELTPSMPCESTEDTSVPGHSYDAIIVGAGTAGLTLAARLAEARLSVVVLESTSDIKRHVCGEYLCPSGVSLARKLGWPELLVGCAPVHGMVLVSPRGRAVPCDFPSDGAHGVGVSLNKQQLNRHLLGRAQRYGADVRFNARVQSFTRQDNGWRITLAGPNPQGDASASTVIDGTLLVGADGRRSTVAEQLGLTIAHDSPRVAIRGYVEPVGSPERRGEMHILADGSYVGVNPISAGEVNVSICMNRDRLKALGGPEAAIRQVVARSKRLSHCWDWSTLRDVKGVYPITHRVRQPIADQAALIGDASGFVDPLTGEGISIAFWTAGKLADLVTEPLVQGDRVTLARALKSYARARRRQFRQKALLSRSFQRVIRKPLLCEFIALALGRSARGRRALMGAIGNNYTPWQAILVLLGIRGRQPRRAADTDELEVRS